MKEIRCVKCNRLLMKIGSVAGDNGGYSARIECKCPKCGHKAFYNNASQLMGFFPKDVNGLCVSKILQKGRLLVMTEEGLTEIHSTR